MLMRYWPHHAGPINFFADLAECNLFIFAGVTLWQRMFGLP